MVDAMTNDGSSLPAGPFLFLTMVTDILIGSIFPEWRQWLPFGLGMPPNGYFSHDISGVLEYFYNLPSYSDYLQSTSQAFSLESLTKYVFYTPSTALGDLKSPTALVTLLFLVLFYRKIKYSYVLPVFTAKGTQIGQATHGKGWVANNQERITKFAEYCIRLCYHFTISAFGIYYFWDKPWWNLREGGTKLLFHDYPNHEIPPGMIWYYLVQCAYNIEALVSLLELSLEAKFQNPLTNYGIPLKLTWSKDCRGDFREMFIHHVITNLLVFGSSTFRLTRIGSIVFLLHDISDVPVDLSKLANFVKWKTATIVFFVTMILVWICTRLVLFPLVAVKSVLMDSHIVTIPYGGSIKQVHHDAVKFFMAGLLIAILALQFLWFGMMMKIGYVLVSKGETHDLTEHKQGEVQEKEKTKTN